VVGTQTRGRTEENATGGAQARHRHHRDFQALTRAIRDLSPPPTPLLETHRPPSFRHNAVDLLPNGTNEKVILLLPPNVPQSSVHQAGDVAVFHIEETDAVVNRYPVDAGRQLVLVVGSSASCRVDAAINGRESPLERF